MKRAARLFKTVDDDELRTQGCGLPLDVVVSPYESELPSPKQEVRGHFWTVQTHPGFLVEIR